MTDRYLSLRATARRVGVSERTLKRYLPDELKTRMGKNVLIHWPTFRQWLEGRNRTIKADDVVMDILRDMARVQ